MNNYEWSLDLLYKGFDDPKFEADMKAVDEKIAELNDFAANLGSMGNKDTLLGYVRISEELNQLASDLYSFAGLRSSTNARDNEANSAIGRLMGKLSATAKAETAAKKFIAEMEDLDALIESDPILKDYEFMLKKIREQNKHLLSEGCEEIMALYSITGSKAWSDLQGFLTSSVTADYRGEDINLSSVRNLAYDPDPAVRKDAYDAELACYEKIKDAVAFALNSIKLEVINNTRLRGFESPLAQTLFQADMKRETLDALLGAMNDHFDIFRRYLKIKAKALGHKNGMPWYDMFAPMGGMDKKYTVEEARDYLLNIFKTFDKDLYDMVERAFAESWIDFYPRDGKRGGAFCSGLEGHKQSRIMTNFDGAFSDIVTLAHELGHAYHNRNIEDHRPLNNGYSMPVAETASTFNENVIMNAAIANASTDDEKLALIESQLMDVTQIICDIYSRYLFETGVFENRENEFMDAARMCEMMLDAQKKAYGDGLDHEVLHPYMWLCKGHYYSGGRSFYNYPYAFGGLFARGLYAMYEEQGESFVPLYKKLLHTTPVATVEDTAKVAGIDLTKKEFWAKSLESYKKNVDEFERLVNKLYK